MVERAGVQPDPPGLAVPRLLQRVREESGADALADRMRHQPEVHDLDFSAAAAVQLGIAARHAVLCQDPQFEPRLGEIGVDLLVAPRQAIQPVPCTSDLPVQEAEERGRASRHTSQPVSRRQRSRRGRTLEHLEIRPGGGNLAGRAVVRETPCRWPLRLAEPLERAPPRSRRLEELRDSVRFAQTRPQVARAPAPARRWRPGRDRHSTRGCPPRCLEGSRQDGSCRRAPGPRAPGPLLRRPCRRCAGGRTR